MMDYLRPILPTPLSVCGDDIHDYDFETHGNFQVTRRVRDEAWDRGGLLPLL